MTKLLEIFTGGSATMYLWLAVAAFIGLLLFGLNHYHKAYIDEVSNNKVLESKNGELILKIKSDSDALVKLAADSKAREELAADALAKAQKKAFANGKKAQEILLANAQVSDNLCLSSDILFNNYIGGK